MPELDMSAALIPVEMREALVDTRSLLSEANRVAGVMLEAARTQESAVRELQNAASDEADA